MATLNDLTDEKLILHLKESELRFNLRYKKRYSFEKIVLFNL